MKYGKSKYCPPKFQTAGPYDPFGVNAMFNQFKPASSCPSGSYFSTVDNKCVPMNKTPKAAPMAEQAQPQAEKPEIGGVPIWNHLLNAGNVIGRQLSENALRNRRGNYYENNAVNPYSGILGYNDGQSDGVKYGTVGYQEGGEIEQEETEYEGQDEQDYEFMFGDEKQTPTVDGSSYQTLYDEGMPNIEDYAGNKEDFAKDLEEWKVEYLSGKESADEDDERNQRSKALLEEFINRRENITAPITFDRKGRASNTGTLEQSISDRESSGNYKAYNPAGGGEGAVGKYQFRWTIHKSWITQVTGVSSKEEFMNNPEAQEKAFQYWKKTNLEPTAKSLYNVAQNTFSW